MFTVITIVTYLRGYVLLAILLILLIYFTAFYIIYFREKSRTDIINSIYRYQLHTGKRESSYTFLIAVFTSWISPCTVWSYKSLFIFVSNLVSIVTQILSFVSIYYIADDFINIFDKVMPPATHCLRKDEIFGIIDIKFYFKNANYTYCPQENNTECLFNFCEDLQKCKPVFRICSENEFPTKTLLNIISFVVAPFILCSFLSSIVLYILSSYHNMYKCFKFLGCFESRLAFNLLKDYKQNCEFLKEEFKNNEKDKPFIEINIFLKLMIENEIMQIFIELFNAELKKQIYNEESLKKSVQIVLNTRSTGEIIKFILNYMECRENENLHKFQEYDENKIFLEILEELGLHQMCNKSEINVWKETLLCKAARQLKIKTFCFFDIIVGHYIEENLTTEQYIKDLLTEYQENGKFDGTFNCSKLFMKWWIKKAANKYNRNIYNAANSGDIFQLENMVTLRANLGLRDEKGNTALHYATERGHLSIVNLLLEKGENINILNQKHQTPLHLATMRGKKMDLFEYLIERGANLLAEDQNKKTPLHYAAELGTSKVVQYLVERNANVNAEDQNKKTPLHYSIEQQSDNIKQYIFDAEENFVTREVNEDGISTFEVAIRNGALECARILVDNGANINAPDEHGNTPSSILLEVIKTAIAIKAYSNTAVIF